MNTHGTRHYSSACFSIYFTSNNGTLVVFQVVSGAAEGAHALATAAAAGVPMQVLQRSYQLMQVMQQQRRRQEQQ
jgi:DNA mismatch repair ATPase MutS